MGDQYKNRINRCPLENIFVEPLVGTDDVVIECKTCGFKRLFKDNWAIPDATISVADGIAEGHHYDRIIHNGQGG